MYRGQEFKCPECDFKANQKAYLVIHKVHMGASARISAKFPTGKGLKELSLQQSIPSEPNFNLMLNKISILIKCNTIFQQSVKLLVELTH